MLFSLLSLKSSNSSQGAKSSPVSDISGAFGGLTFFHGKLEPPCEAPHSLVHPFCWLQPGDCGQCVLCWCCAACYILFLYKRIYSGIFREASLFKYFCHMSLLMVEAKISRGCSGGGESCFGLAAKLLLCMQDDASIFSAFK